VAGNPAPDERPPRLASVDAYRGFVMLLLFGEVLRFCAVSQALPDSATWCLLCMQQTHAVWVGMHLHDLIQPGFTFLVGVSIPLSIAARTSRGATFRSLFPHAVFRSAVLIVLGVAMLAIHPRHILWKLEDTLSQIGLGYAFVYCLAFLRVRSWWLAFGAILVLWWALFALSPLPASDFDYAAVGVTPEWLRQYGLSGWEAHWQKNANVAYAFDLWFLELLPENEHYVAPTGLTTLNFVPTMATMTLGMVAGRTLRTSDSPSSTLRTLVALGIAGLASGGILAASGVSPLIKALWTSSWVLVSGGACFLMMAAFFYLIEVRGLRRMFVPLIVIGCNSIVAYVMQHAYPALAWGGIRHVVGEAPFRIFGAAYEPLLYGIAVLLLYWLVLLILYRRRWFVRI
jgi:heparan-alpha-glucosaminide N-acetyltransferase